MLVKCFLLLLCYHLLLSGAVSEFTTTVYPAKVFSSSQCGQYSPYNEQLREVLQQIEQNIPKILPASIYMVTTHQLPQATTTSLLPMAVLYRSTVAWRGPTVEERETGQGWPMSTWHNLVVPAHKDWNKQLTGLVCTDNLHLTAAYSDHYTVYKTTPTLSWYTHAWQGYNVCVEVMYALCYITRARVHGPRAWSYKSNTARVHVCDIMNLCSIEAILPVLPRMLAKQV